IADVGQDLFEEVNFQQAAAAGGQNYGWPVFEGVECFNDHSSCDSPGLFDAPVHTYPRSFGGSVTGGYVYRGGRIPWLRGAYFFGDFLSSRIASFALTENEVTDLIDRTTALTTGLSPTLGGI